MISVYRDHWGLFVKSPLSVGQRVQHFSYGYGIVVDAELNTSAPVKYSVRWDLYGCTDPVYLKGNTMEGPIWFHRSSLGPKFNAYDHIIGLDDIINHLIAHRDSGCPLDAGDCGLLLSRVGINPKTREQRIVIAATEFVGGKRSAYDDLKKAVNSQ